MMKQTYAEWLAEVFRIGAPEILDGSVQAFEDGQSPRQYVQNTRSSTRDAAFPAERD